VAELTTGAAGAFSFGKALRLRKHPQFVQIQRQGQRCRRGGLIFLLQPNQLPNSRLGITITRKTQPQACKRNQMKRRLREAFRTASLPGGWDIVIIVTRQGFELNLQQVRELILWAVKRENPS
jgi:ribonuclease P protein component